MQSKTWWLLAAALVIAAIIVAILVNKYGLPRLGRGGRRGPVFLFVCFIAPVIYLYKGGIKRLIRCSCNPKHPVLSKYD